MLEPSSVYEDDEPPPEWRCFDCGHKWVPVGYWDYDDSWIYVPDDDTCPNCGSEYTDEEG